MRRSAPETEITFELTQNRFVRSHATGTGIGDAVSNRVDHALLLESLLRTLETHEDGLPRERGSLRENLVDACAAGDPRQYLVRVNLGPSAGACLYQGGLTPNANVRTGARS